MRNIAKPYWSPALKAAHTHARHLRRTWISEDRPQGHHHPSYLLYKEAKTQFRRQQRQHIVTNQNKVFDDLNKTADVNYRQFWKLLHKNTDRKSSVCTALTVNDVCYSNENVISGFANYFKGIFSNTVVDNAAKEHVARMQLHDNPTSTGLTQLLTVEEIANITKSLQKRKRPGHDNLVSEHKLNALQPVNKALDMLFNSSFVHERILVTWKTSVVIPIYKGKGKSKSDPNSYRPISLIPVFCKVLERAILNRINSHLLNNRIPFPNSQQHGFQKGPSCITAAFN